MCEMTIFGGEAELNKRNLYSYITDSGRSSLRLILQNRLKNKRFLLPDLLCDVILRVFDELEVRYSFYSVKPDLSLDCKDILSKQFDVLYLINFFGQRSNILNQIQNVDFMVIEDNVFLPNFEKPENVKNWIGFNSFRKISKLADGSIIKSSVKLPEELILKKEAKFSRLKYEAKKFKYDFLYESKSSEEKYVTLFSKAEKVLNRQKKIYSISNRSLFELFEYYKNFEEEYLRRQKNYETLDKYLKHSSITLKAEYYSFYVLNVKYRDELREYLFPQKVFLPVHWQKSKKAKNILSDNIISIPVDSRYSTNDMKAIAKLINDFYSTKV